MGWVDGWVESWVGGFLEGVGKVGDGWPPGVPKRICIFFMLESCHRARTFFAAWTPTCHHNHPSPPTYQHSPSFINSELKVCIFQFEKLLHCPFK